MKPDRPSDPTRWREADADRQALESRAAALADAAKQSPPLAPQALSRIRGEVLARRSGGPAGGRAWLWLPFRLKPILAAAVLVACATTAVGAGVLWRRHVESIRPATPPADDSPVRRAPRPPARLPARAVAVVDEPPEPPAPASAPMGPPDEPARSVAVAPRPVEPPRTIEPPPPPAAPSPAPQATTSEAALVSQALFELRQRHDARAALSALDRYAREFPHGVLETEAFRTRVEALIQLGDIKAALALLDGASAADVLGAELLLSRAELRAAAGRFREALADFTELVDRRVGSLAAAGDERALYGRAVCLGRLAEHERARAALNAYRHRFPDGRFTAEVERLLAGPVSGSPP